MEHGKTQKQAIAIAYSVRRRKKKASGGMIAKDVDDKEMLHKNSGDKPAHNDKVLDQPELKQDRSPERPGRQPIKHPKIMKGGTFTTKLRDQEDDLEASDKVNNGPEHQPPEEYNEMEPDRKGPMVAALEMKKMAEGGMAEMDEDHHDSISAAIMAKRKKMHDMIDSGAMDEDHAEAMAEGGEVNGEDSIYSDDSSQADLSRNAEEDANMEDQASFDALRKENYSESEGLKKLSHPKADDEDGDSIDSDDHDMIGSIRKKMKSKGQF